MTNIIEMYRPKLVALWEGKQLSEAERAVLKIIWSVSSKGAKISQRQIAQNDNWLGCHPKYESDIVKRKAESTLRNVRQIIRDLRVVHSVPILSDRSGYWLPKTMSEVTEYIERMEAVARAQSASWHQTYRAVRQNFNVQSSFFDKLDV